MLASRNVSHFVVEVVPMIFPKAVYLLIPVGVGLMAIFYTIHAIAASSGTLGVVIPPSIPMVTYAVTANESIIAMFGAG